MVMVMHCPAIQGQMDYYNDMYDAQSNYGTRAQNWFGSYQLGYANPYQYLTQFSFSDAKDIVRLMSHFISVISSFVSTMPYGYGSGAMPFFSHPNSGGYPGTSYAPGGYMASALMPNNVNNYQPPPPPPPPFYNNYPNNNRNPNLMY